LLQNATKFLQFECSSHIVMCKINVSLQQLFQEATMHKILLTTILLAFLTVPYSCKTVQIEKPAEAYVPAAIQPAVSELPLMIELDLKKLETALNREMQGLLFQGEKLNNQDLSVKVWKANNFSFTIKNNQIEYRVPLKIWSRFGWTVEKFGLRASDTYEANGAISLNFATTISLDRNWKLIAHTASKGYQWIEAPRVNIMGIAVPVTPIANYALQESQKMITEQIDKTLSEMVELRNYAAMAWNEMQKPMLMSNENQLWLKITPNEVAVSPLETIQQKLTLTVGLKAQIESYMGSKPAASKTIPLPALKTVSSKPGVFNLNIAADATYTKISELASSQLLNKTFTEGKKSITITGLQLYGRNGKAVIEADVTGSIKGRIYFTGDMIYNPEKVAVEVQNPEFDINTRNALVKSANWLLNGIIIKKISPFLTYPVKEELEYARKEANKMLANYPVYNGIALQGQLNTITVTAVNLVPGAVRLQANLKGNVKLKVDDFNL